MNSQFRMLIDTSLFEEMTNYSGNSKIAFKTAITHFLTKIGNRERV